MNTQRIRHYGVVTATGEQPDNKATRNISVAALVGLLIIGAFIGMRAWGEYSAAQRSADPPVIEVPAIQVKSVPLTTGAQTVKIPTGLTEYPNLTLTVVAGGDGWRITDEDGDKGWCPMKPATLADLDHCRHIED